MANEVQKLHAGHRRALQLMAIGRLSIKEIATEVGLCPTTLRAIKKSPVGQKEMQRLQRIQDAQFVNVQEQLQATAAYSAELIDDVVRDEIEGETIPMDTRISQANKTMDRAGYVPPKQVEARIVHAHFTSQQIADIKQRATKLAIEDTVEDAVVVEAKDLPEEVDDDGDDSEKQPGGSEESTD